MIKGIYTGSEFIESAASGNEIGIILESTSFYAEQGGQVLCIYILFSLVACILHCICLNLNVEKI